MSDWSMDRTEEGAESLRFWNADLGYEICVTKIKGHDQYTFVVEWYEEVGHHQEKRESAMGYASGRNLEVLRAFLLEPIAKHFISENARLHDLVRRIKYQAIGLGDFDAGSALGEWICSQISDTDAEWG